MMCVRSRWCLVLGVSLSLVLPSMARGQTCVGGGAPVWFSHGTSEYYRCDDAQTFTVARNHCHTTLAGDSSNYYLARPTDSSENAAIAAGIPSGTRWLGGNDLTGPNNDWRFTAGLANNGVALGYFSWSGGEPNNVAGQGCGQEECIEVVAGTGLWNDNSCCGTTTYATGYVCEGNARCGNGVHASTEQCDDGNTTSGDGCSSTCTIEPAYACGDAEPSVCSPVCFLSSRSALGDSVYVHCDGGPFKTWANASIYCRQQGGHLARVDGIDEQYHLTRSGGLVNLTGGSTWMGGNDTVTEAAWHWSSLASDSGAQFWSGAAGGAAVGSLYTQWSNGEPNDGGGQDCGVFWDGDVDRR